MKDWRGKRYWIVGASEGLGKALAEVISRAGADVILSARSADKLTLLAQNLPGRARIIPIDVGDSGSVAGAAHAAGDIDGMIFAAGVYWPMRAQDWNAQKAEAMLDINLIGAARVLGHVVPQFVAKDTGHIVLIGSLSSFGGLPGAIGYAASKAGLLSLAQSLDGDLRHTGIDVQLINPGFIKTRLTDQNTFNMPFLMDPERAAQICFDHMNSARFARAFPTGFSLIFRLSRFLPHALYRRLFF